MAGVLQSLSLSAFRKLGLLPALLQGPGFQAFALDSKRFTDRTLLWEGGWGVVGEKAGSELTPASKSQDSARVLGSKDYMEGQHGL